MTEEAKKARREYARKWRKKHPEKNREYIARHWEKVAKEKESEEETAEDDK